MAILADPLAIGTEGAVESTGVFVDALALATIGVVVDAAVAVAVYRLCLYLFAIKPHPQTTLTLKVPLTTALVVRQTPVAAISLSSPPDRKSVV